MPLSRWQEGPWGCIAGMPAPACANPAGPWGGFGETVATGRQGAGQGAALGCSNPCVQATLSRGRACLPYPKAHASSPPLNRWRTASSCADAPTKAFGMVGTLIGAALDSPLGEYSACSPILHSMPAITSAAQPVNHHAAQGDSLRRSGSLTARGRSSTLSSDEIIHPVLAKWPIPSGLKPCENTFLLINNKLFAWHGGCNPQCTD